MNVNQINQDMREINNAYYGIATETIHINKKYGYYFKKDQIQETIEKAIKEQQNHIRRSE